MTPLASRLIKRSPGTTVDVDFVTTHSDDWTDEELRGLPITADEVGDARFLLKRRVTDPDDDAVVAKTLAAGIAVADGTATVALGAADTVGLRGEYVGTLRFFLANGKVEDWEDADYGGIPYVTLRFTQGAVEATE